MKNKRFRDKRFNVKQLKQAAHALKAPVYATLVKLDQLEDERGQVPISNKELAQYCGISPATLKVHLAVLRRKKFLVESERATFWTPSGPRERTRVRVVRPVEYNDFKEMCRKLAKPIHYWLMNRPTSNIRISSLYRVLETAVKCLVGEAIIEPVFEDFALTKLKMRMCDDPNLARR